MRTLFFLFLLIPSIAYSQFRSTTWGMSPDEVKEVETLNFVAQDDDQGMIYLMYQGSVGNMDVILGYMFVNNELATASYDFKETYLSMGQYIEQYNRIKGILKDNYGSPTHDLENWNNETLKEYTDLATGISLGYVTLNTQFDTDDMMVQTELETVNFETSHTVLYFSKSHMEAVRNAFSNQNKSDF